MEGVARLKVWSGGDCMAEMQGGVLWLPAGAPQLQCPELCGFLRPLRQEGAHSQG